jgi:hypothetical protein
LGSNDVWVGSLFGIFIFRQRVCSHMWMPAGMPKLIGKAGQIVIMASWAFFRGARAGPQETARHSKDLPRDGGVSFVVLDPSAPTREGPLQ